MADLLRVAFDVGLVARQRNLSDRHVIDLCARNVNRDVDHYRARAAAASNVESLVDRARNLLSVGHHEGVLDARHRDADRVGLLKTVGAEQVAADLAGHEDDRNGIHHRVNDRCDEVRRAWP